jgi:lysozyme family protein
LYKNFNRSLAEVLASEGGYVNHPSDPGGHTNYGITLSTYRRVFGKSRTVNELRNIPKTQVSYIYRTQYWNVCRCDDLPSGVDYSVFDFAVNSGPGRAARYLQSIVGADIDGVIGSETIQKTRVMSKIRGSAAIITALCDKRMAFLERLKTWKVFRRGWTRRVNKVRAVSLKMAAARPWYWRFLWFT